MLNQMIYLFTMFPAKRKNRISQKYFRIFEKFSRNFASFIFTEKFAKCDRKFSRNVSFAWNPSLKYQVGWQRYMIKQFGVVAKVQFLSILRKLARNALIGFCSSVVSDTISNSLRVIKTTRQTYTTPIRYIYTICSRIDSFW